jgi:hypothetical protein
VKTLAKEHLFLVVDRAGTPESPVWSVNSLSLGWRLLNPGAPSGYFVSETFFDLAGMSQREKTLFFEGATVQEILNPTVFTGGPGDNLVIVDLMCTKSLTDTELLSFPVGGNFASPGATLTFEETVYARINQFVIDLDTAAWGSMVQVNSNQIGSLKATASDRIYSYRIIVAGSPFTGTRFDITSARHLLQATAKEEADFQYLMRLRRSYELAQNHDED